MQAIIDSGGILRVPCFLLMTLAEPALRRGGVPASTPGTQTATVRPSIGCDSIRALRSVRRDLMGHGARGGSSRPGWRNFAAARRVSVDAEKAGPPVGGNQDQMGEDVSDGFVRHHMSGSWSLPQRSQRKGIDAEGPLEQLGPGCEDVRGRSASTDG